MPPDCLIRAAAPDQTAAVLALLPALCRARRAPDQWWLAHRRDQPWAVVAAAAFEPVVRPDDGRDGCGGFPLHLHVLPAWRRQGLGRALVARLLDQARGWAVDALQTPGSLAPDEPAAAFLAAIGARRGVPTHHYLARTEATLAAYQRREQALQSRGRIPPGFSAVPLHQVPLDAAASLLAWQFGGGSDAARAGLEQHLQDPLARALSFAVWDGAMLAALLLGTAQPAGQASGAALEGRVDHWVAEPSLRQGWAALLALTAHLRALQGLGIAQGRFSCSERATATVNVARRSGATLVALRHVYLLDVFARSETDP